MKGDDVAASTINSAQLAKPSAASSPSELRWGIASHAGTNHKENQDSFGYLVTKQFAVFLVSDGMGGALGGAMASSLAVNLILRLILDNKKRITEDSVRAAIESANSLIFELGSENPELKGMGSTVALVAILPQETIVAHIGDSRVYLIQGANCKKLTVDHTLVQELVDSGAIAEQHMNTHPMSHVLTRALGPNQVAEIEVKTLTNSVQPGDRFLICCDGIFKQINQAELFQAAVGVDLDDAVGMIAQGAIDGGLAMGNCDDVTVELIEIGSFNQIHRAGLESNGSSDCDLDKEIEFVVSSPIQSDVLSAVGRFLENMDSPSKGLIPKIAALNIPLLLGEEKQSERVQSLGADPYINSQFSDSRALTDSSYGLQSSIVDSRVQLESILNSAHKAAGIRSSYLGDEPQLNLPHGGHLKSSVGSRTKLLLGFAATAGIFLFLGLFLADEFREPNNEIILANVNDKASAPPLSDNALSIIQPLTHPRDFLVTPAGNNPASSLEVESGAHTTGVDNHSITSASPSPTERPTLAPLASISDQVKMAPDSVSQPQVVVKLEHPIVPTPVIGPTSSSKEQKAEATEVRRIVTVEKSISPKGLPSAVLSSKSSAVVVPKPTTIAPTETREIRTEVTSPSQLTEQPLSLSRTKELRAKLAQGYLMSVGAEVAKTDGDIKKTFSQITSYESQLNRAKLQWQKGELGNNLVDVMTTLNEQIKLKKKKLNDDLTNKLNRRLTLTGP